MSPQAATYPQEGRCATCGSPGWFVEHHQWAGTHYELLDAWWSHSVHPADEHEFLPVLGDVCPWHPQSRESADRAARTFA